MSDVIMPEAGSLGAIPSGTVAPVPVSALGHESFEGFARIAEIGPLGMISLRAALDAPLLAEALAASGFALPQPRRIARTGNRRTGWMSPDELLLVLPYAEVTQALAALTMALQGSHHLAVDVSDARAVFRVEGELAADVLRKLAPADLDRLAQGELRRTRAAQVACAFWREGDGFTLVCFRSVARYMMDLLRHSALPGSELGA